MGLKTAWWVANSVDPDQMPHIMGLNYLLRPVCPDTWGKPPLHHTSKLWTTSFYYLLTGLKAAKWVAIDEDPDNMSHSVAYDLGLHCLLRLVCPNTWDNLNSLTYFYGKLWTTLFYWSKYCWMRGKQCRLWSVAMHLGLHCLLSLYVWIFGVNHNSLPYFYSKNSILLPVNVSKNCWMRGKQCRLISCHATGSTLFAQPICPNIRG